MRDISFISIRYNSWGFYFKKDTFREPSIYSNFD